MELAQAKICSLLIFILPQQAHDLPLTHHVRDLLCRTCGGACCFASGGLTVQSSSLHEILNCLIEGPLAGVEIHVYSDSSRAISRQSQDLALARRVVGIET